MRTNGIIEEFRDGVFSLRTRRFGKLAEIMIKKKYKLEYSKKSNYDLQDNNGQRIEVKFSTVLNKCHKRINEKTVVKECIASNVANRAMKSVDIANEKFDCNIQQIKCSEFDVLYYGLFFLDEIRIYKMTSQQVLSAPGYSNKQHRGNTGEGQFHIKNDSMEYHKSYLIDTLSYEDLYKLLE